jgi:hypothetical protein
MNRRDFARDSSAVIAAMALSLAGAGKKQLWLFPLFSFIRSR